MPFPPSLRPPAAWPVTALALGLLALGAAPSAAQGGALGALSPEERCAELVQGRIAWDYRGSTRWAKDNVASLCRGTRVPTEPPKCFDRVMHGGVDWGGSVRWRWENALRLCAGTDDATATVTCFQTRRSQGTPWYPAIQWCRARR